MSFALCPSQCKRAFGPQVEEFPQTRGLTFAVGGGEHVLGVSSLGTQRLLGWELALGQILNHTAQCCASGLQ